VPNHEVLYRALTVLYPKEFRDRYREDLVQHFADLARDRGARAAWARTGLDLAVTVPRYRMECIMSEQRTAMTTAIAVGGLAAAGILMTLSLGLSWGLVPLGLAVVLGVAQRSALARAIRTPGTTRRRRRLTIGAVLALVFAGSVAGFFQAVSDDHISDTSLLAFNVIGAVTLVGAVSFLIAGAFTPKTLPGA
jgi:hypothetical protein